MTVASCRSGVYGRLAIRHHWGCMHDALFAQGGLSLERLRTFCAIVQAGGIGAGAGDDPVRQSQFSRQLRELERFFGAELIVRGRGPLRLSPVGTELLQLASTLLGGLEELLLRSRNLPVTLRIGAGESLIQWWLLARLPSGWAEGTQVTPTFENRRNREIIDGLLDGSLDLGVTSRSMDEPRLEYRALAPLKYQLFVPTRLMPRDVAGADGIPDDLPFAEIASTGMVAQALEQEWKRRGAPLRRVLRLSSYPQLASVVAAGRAAAVLPDFAARYLEGADVGVWTPAFLKALDGELRLVWNPGMLEVRPAIARVLPSLTKAWTGKAGAKLRSGPGGRATSRGNSA